MTSDNLQNSPTHICDNCIFFGSLELVGYLYVCTHETSDHFRHVLSCGHPACKEAEWRKAK